MTTRRGELSIAVESFALLGKALLEAPDKHRGLTDVETRYRQRYVDLAANERTREIFRIRHTAIRAIRRHLEDQGFTEVEGPVLQTIQGGASARPFVTHHNALDLDMYLRIALELHLKRLIVGGHGAGVRDRPGVPQRGHRHPAQPRVHDARGLPGLRRLPRHDGPGRGHDHGRRAGRPSADDGCVVHYGGHAIDLAAAPWPRVRFADMIAEKTGATMHPGMPIDEARAVLDRLRHPLRARAGARAG